MIPLNAAEAADLIRCRRREIATAKRQIEHFGVLQDNARERLARLESEVAVVAAMFPPPRPASSGSGETVQREGGADHG